LILTQRSQDRGEFGERLHADPRAAEFHASAIALVEHPVRQLATEIRPLVRVDARQILAASVRRDPQNLSEQRMPGIGDPRGAKTVCGMSLGGLTA